MQLKSKPKEVLQTYLHFRITQLYEMVRSSLVKENDPKTEQLARLKAQMDSSDMDITELFSIERELIAICPDGLVSQLYESRKDKLLLTLPIEGPIRLAKLETSSPTENNNIANQKTNLLVICGWLHEYYFFINTRELFISYNKQKFITILLYFLAITCVAIVIAFLLHYLGKNADTMGFSLAVAMACAGYLGATISIVRRFRVMAESAVDGVDREDKLLKLEQGQKGIYLSLLFGVLSPYFVLLFLYIISTSMSLIFLGIELIPHISIKSEAVTVCDLLFRPVMLTPTDLVRLLIISVCSGFFRATDS